jgi:hypothetical protein
MEPAKRHQRENMREPRSFSPTMPRRPFSPPPPTSFLRFEDDLVCHQASHLLHFMFSSHRLDGLQGMISGMKITEMKSSCVKLMPLLKGSGVGPLTFMFESVPQSPPP